MRTPAGAAHSLSLSPLGYISCSDAILFKHFCHLVTVPSLCMVYRCGLAFSGEMKRHFLNEKGVSATSRGLEMWLPLYGALCVQLNFERASAASSD